MKTRLRSTVFFTRLASVITTLFGISIFVFIVLRVIPGDSITGSLGIETGALNEEQIAALKVYYGIDKSLVGQYFSWMSSFLSGDFGFAYSLSLIHI